MSLSLPLGRSKTVEGGAGGGSPASVTPPHKQKGVALIASLFLLVALGALAVYIVTLSGVQHQTPTLAADGARAYYIARSAAEATGYQAAQNDACPGSFPTPVDGFDVIMDCSELSEHVEAGRSFSVFRVSATASRGTLGSGNFVSRTVETTVRTDQ